MYMYVAAVLDKTSIYLTMYFQSGSKLAVFKAPGTVLPSTEINVGYDVLVGSS